jgi:hypothetical protein
MGKKLGMNFEVNISYYEDAEDWRSQGIMEHFMIEAPHMVDALHELARNFPARYAGDISEVYIQRVDRKIIKTDHLDPIREGDGWKAKEGRDIP